MGNKKQDTGPELLATAERRAYVLQLRRGGATYRDIAGNVLNTFGADKLPQGWDERYAYKDVKRELDRVRGEIAESAEDVLTLELERLDRMFLTMFDRAIKGDEKAVDRCLRIMQRRSDLLGLDAPKRQEISGPDGEAAVVELRVVHDR